MNDLVCVPVIRVCGHCSSFGMRIWPDLHLGDCVGRHGWVAVRHTGDGDSADLEYQATSFRIRNSPPRLSETNGQAYLTPCAEGPFGIVL